MVDYCYRGTPDEVNNQILATFNLHPQTCELLIKQKRIRIVPLKIVNAIKIILLKLRKSKQYRDPIIHALAENDIPNDLLKEIDYQDFVNELTKDDLKTIAFQIIQSLALMEGREIFTKDESSSFCPDLACFVKRKEVSKLQLATLTEFQRKLVNCMARVTTIKKGSLALFRTKSEVQAENFYEAQSVGLVLDIKKEKSQVIHLPLFSSCPLASDWPEKKKDAELFSDHLDENEEWFGLICVKRRFYMTTSSQLEGSHSGMMKEESFKNVKLADFDFDHWSYYVRMNRLSRKVSLCAKRNNRTGLLDLGINWKI